MRRNRPWRRAGAALLCVGLLWGTGAARVVDVPAPASLTAPEPGSLWRNEGDSLEGVLEAHHLTVWQVEDYELETMYGDAYALRRSANTQEAWLTLELPYVEEMRLLSYAWPVHEGTMTVLLSRDGETWREAQPEITRTPDPEATAESARWTQYLYELTNLSGVRYVKLLWPEVDPAQNDWWNPYLGWIEARLGTPTPQAVTYLGPETFEIPRFDPAEYQLKAMVADQLGEPVEAELAWSAPEGLPPGVTLAETGLLTVAPDCQDGAVLCLTAAADTPEPLSLTVELTLRAAILGDVTRDGVLNRDDLNFVCLHYGQDGTSPDWKTVRLADIDENGRIDVVDLAYLAYHTGDSPAGEPGEDETHENEETEETEDKGEEHGA